MIDRLETAVPATKTITLKAKAPDDTTVAVTVLKTRLNVTAAGLRGVVPLSNVATLIEVLQEAQKEIE